MRYCCTWLSYETTGSNIERCKSTPFCLFDFRREEKNAFGMERDLHSRWLHKCEISFRNISDRMKVKTEADYLTTKEGPDWSRSWW